MNFFDAVLSVLTNYVDFKGRARRSEYWWFFLFDVIVSVIVSLFDVAAGTQVLEILVGVALLLPGLAVTIRRLHDTDRRGWWVLIGLVPIVGMIVLIVFACQDSEPGSNRFGDSPKYPGNSVGWGVNPAIG
jgi:uncharacterized membrane protein YhaH (DUF805 family)